MVTRIAAAKHVGKHKLDIGNEWNNYASGELSRMGLLNYILITCMIQSCDGGY